MLDLQRKRLGEILIGAGLLSREQVVWALAAQESQGGRFGQILVEARMCTEEDLRRALAQQLGLDWVADSDLLPEPDVVHLVPRHLAERHGILPIRVRGGELTIATADPTDVVATDDVELVTGLRVRRVVATASGVHAGIDAAYAPQLTVVGEQVRTPREVDDGQATAALLALLEGAIVFEAEALHLEEDAVEVTVRRRLGQTLETLPPLPAGLGRAVINRVKRIAGIDPFQRRRVQTGRCRLQVARQAIDVVVSVLPTVRGESISVALRNRDRSRPTLGTLGLADRQIDALRTALNASTGLVVLAGPPGPSRRDTLYALLDAFAGGARMCVLVEEASDADLPGVTQVETQPAGIDAVQGFDAARQHGADVIALADVRATALVRAAVEAADDRLVLVALHADSSVAAVIRLLELGADGHLLSITLRAAIAQRAVPLRHGEGGRTLAFQVLDGRLADRVAVRDGNSEVLSAAIV